MGLFDRFFSKRALAESSRAAESETWLREGEHLAQAGHYPEAVERLRRGMEGSTDPTAKAFAQRLLEDCMRNVLSRLDDDDDPVWNTNRLDEAWANKADLLLSLGRHKEGLRCAERALNQNKSSALGWYVKGACIAALGDRKAAIPCYDEAIRLKPDLAQAWNNKGFSLKVLGCFHEALPCYRRAVELQPSLVIAWLNIGEALALLGRLDEALEETVRGLAAVPNEPRLLVQKGAMLHNLGRTQEGLALLKIAKARGYVGADEIIAKITESIS